MKDSELKEYMEFLPDDVLAAGNKYLDVAENAAPDVNSSAEVKQPKTTNKPARDGRKFRVWLPVLLGVIVVLCVAAGIVLAVKLPKQPGKISEPTTVANTPDDTEMIANTPVPTIDPDGVRITGSIILGVPEAYGQTDREALAKYVEAFRKQCPYVEVETRIISSAEAALKAEAGSPDYADVVFFPGKEAFEYAYVDHTLMLLDDIANQTGVKNDIHSGVYESCTVSGNLYAMGTNCDPLLLIYNKDAIEALALANEVGGSWTFDEFCKLCRTIGQSGEDFAGAQLDFKYEPLFLSLLRVCSGREIKSWAIPERCSVEYVTRVRKDMGSSAVWYDNVGNVVLQELYALRYAYTDGYNSILPAKDVFDGVNNVQ
ncbi:MAG: extracellular solute-binding protein, partial [Clostridia bacterium]|nr:extracellular solute-binding protein [Clostridia bacterium]